MDLSRTILGFAGALTLALAGCDSDDDDTGDSGGQGGTAGGSGQSKTNFFVSSEKSPTGNLGGLRGADARCAALAEAVGLGSKTWRAYLSVEADPDNGGGPTHARDRIGSGPWYNINDALIANDLDSLHARSGDAELFVDERGQKVPGQWMGSPTPNEHDILTGTMADGTVAAGLTCADWTSDSATLTAQTGHSDGLGPGMASTPPFNSWHASHPNAGCNDTAPRGGAGRIYCFANN
jgi:hypothetical protein